MTKELFIAKNLPNFQIENTNWEELVKALLAEFYDAGWDTSIAVKGKNKFNRLRCTLWHNKLQYLAPFYAICDKYEVLSLIN